MYQYHFVKYHRAIDKITSSQQGTLILSSLEFWFIKKPDGFYKFLEPCSHRLYKKGDSWLEEIGLSRKRFARAFKKFGIKYYSRSAFEEAEDKFKGKLYASYYDRHTNQMFFVRNHELANETLKPYFKSRKAASQKKQGASKKSAHSLPDLPLSTGHNGLSYKEAKNTSGDLSKDKSHANDEIVKKMLELWAALVEGGKSQIELTSKRIAFLKQAFKDKFDNCLDKWKKYCQDIASSRFLMGEIKSSFRATLDWALKFETIQKILEGNYGIGDRNPLPAMSAAGVFVKNSKIEIVREVEAIQQAIDEPQPVREFRLKWLNKFGASNYCECLKTCVVEVADETTLILRPGSRYTAKLISSWWIEALLDDSPFKRAHIIQQEGGLVFNKWFGESQGGEGAPPEPEHETISVNAPCDLNMVPISLLLPEIAEDMKAFTGRPPKEGETVEGQQPEGVAPVSPETRMFREKLRQVLHPGRFPDWLGAIEVDPIGKDGKVVVTFKDPLVVEWCRLRFSQEIFEVAASLWKGVNRLVIRQKEGHPPDLSVENFPQKSENVKQKMTLEQGIQFLVSTFCDRSQEMFGMRNPYQTLA